MINSVLNSVVKCNLIKSNLSTSAFRSIQCPSHTSNNDKPENEENQEHIVRIKDKQTDLDNFGTINDVYDRPSPTTKAVTSYVPIRLPPMPHVGDLLRIYGIKTRKQMSQNFLLDGRQLSRIVRCIGIREGDTVLEIGPGPGNITRKILEKGPKEVFTIEKDRRFLPMLEMLADAAQPGQMKIVLGDVRDFSLNTIFSEDLKKDWNSPDLPRIHVFGNLPFNISTPLLIRMLQQMSTRQGVFAYGRVPLTLTFQKEFGMRMGAPPLDYARSRLSFMVQYLADMQHKFNIKANSFVPAPKVDVGVVRLVPKVKPLIEDVPFKTVEKFNRVFFHNRKQYIIKAIRNLFPPDKQDLVYDFIREANLNVEYNAMMFATDEICEFVKLYWQYCESYPDIADYDFRTKKKLPHVVAELF